MNSPSRRASIPALIGVAFGSLWAFGGCSALPHPWRSPLLLAAGLVTVVLLPLVLRRSAAPSHASRLFRSRPYLLAVLFEVAAIIAASNLLPRVSLQQRLPQVVGIIVGLHFLGLWKATTAQRFLWIAAGMTCLSALALLEPSVVGTFHPADALTGFGNALILWCGAATPLALEPSSPAKAPSCFCHQKGHRNPGAPPTAPPGPACTASPSSPAPARLPPIAQRRRLSLPLSLFQPA